MSLGRRIKAARIARGLTQEALADAADMKVDTLRKLEQGVNETTRSIAKLAAALEMTPAALQYGEPETPPVLDTSTADEVPLGLGDDLERVMELLDVSDAYRARLRAIRFRGGRPMGRGTLTNYVEETVRAWKAEETGKGQDKTEYDQVVDPEGDGAMRLAPAKPRKGAKR